MGRGTSTGDQVAAEWAQCSSRVERNMVWKGGLTLDHCGQPWDGRRRAEGSGLVTGREDQGMPQAEPSFKTVLLPQGPLQALMHALKLDSRSSFRS